jgi:hypothetical protein
LFYEDSRVVEKYISSVVEKFGDGGYGRSNVIIPFTNTSKSAGVKSENGICGKFFDEYYYKDSKEFGLGLHRSGSQAMKSKYWGRAF